MQQPRHWRQELEWEARTARRWARQLEKEPEVSKQSYRGRLPRPVQAGRDHRPLLRRLCLLSSDLRRVLALQAPLSWPACEQPCG